MDIANLIRFGGGLKSVMLALSMLASLVACSRGLETYLVGQWEYAVELELPTDSDTPGGVMKISCEEGYFPNKSVNSDCSFQIASETINQNGEAIETVIAGTYRATGEWSIAKGIVYVKTVDGKVDLQSISVDGQGIADPAVIAEVRRNMGDVFIKGETTAVKTISINKSSWIFEEEVEKIVVRVSASRRVGS
jgi:hypothetical protein